MYMAPWGAATNSLTFSSLLYFSRRVSPRLCASLPVKSVVYGLRSGSPFVHSEVSRRDGCEGRAGALSLRLRLAFIVRSEAKIICKSSVEIMRSHVGRCNVDGSYPVGFDVDYAVLDLQGAFYREEAVACNDDALSFE